MANPNKSPIFDHEFIKYAITAYPNLLVYVSPEIDSILKKEKSLENKIEESLQILVYI
jgi:hypothetical protein